MQNLHRCYGTSIKKLCVLESGDVEASWNLLLSDDQIRMLNFLNEQGWDFKVKIVSEPIEV